MRVSFVASLAASAALIVLSPLAPTSSLAQTGSSSTNAADQRPVLLRESFPIGDADGVLCQVQDRSVGNPARQTMFDRAWAVVCRDSAVPVVNLYAFNDLQTDPIGLIAPYRRESVDCAQSKSSTAEMGAAQQTCTVAGTQLGWSIYRAQQGGTTFVAEGLAAYDSAATLALRSVMGNQIARGTIDIATTSIADPLAFARVQAETLEPQQALNEGYRRNLGGEYAEAAAYFETLQKRLESEAEIVLSRGEFLVNRALQKSNLSEFGEADRLFIEADPLNLGDPIAERLHCNSWKFVEAAAGATWKRRRGGRAANI